jgi:hypothetical protein
MKNHKKHNWLTQYIILVDYAIIGNYNWLLSESVNRNSWWHNLPKYILRQSIVFFLFTIINLCLLYFGLLIHYLEYKFTLNNGKADRNIFNLYFSLFSFVNFHFRNLFFLNFIHFNCKWAYISIVTVENGYVDLYVPFLKSLETGYN